MVGRIKYSVLSEQELEHLKLRLEQLLIERGIRLDHEEMLDALAAAGCIVNKAAGEVRFTKALIDQAVTAVPGTFTLYSPGGERDLIFPHPHGEFYVRTNTGAPIYHTADGNAHFVRPEEVDEWYKLTNAMNNVDFVALPSMTSEEIPVNAIDVYTLERALNHSAKHIWVQPYEADNVKYLIDMAAAAMGGHDKLREKPIISLIACGIPCLTFKRMDAEILYQSAKYGIPVQPCSLPTAGANTPVTAQGTAFVAMAEVLAMIVMLELLCPGLPVIATPLLFSMDMQTTYTLQSNTEITIARLIAMELFERGYNIRAHSYGTGTDSLNLDAQNFIERTSLTDAMAMSEASVLGGAGQLETAKTISPIQLIIDNEIFGIAQRIRRGLAVNDETLNWDELLSGVDTDPAFTYLRSEHTFRHFAEPHRPAMFNRSAATGRPEEDGIDLLMRARETYDAIMAAEETYTLPADKAAAVEAVRKAAHAALVKE